MAKSKYDWVAIKTEWDLGQLSVREIARQHGVADHTAITKRAQRHGWAERPEVTDVVTAFVTNAPRDDSVVTITPRVALAAFDRVLKLLHRHRRQMGSLASEIDRCFEDIAKHRAKLAGKGKDVPLYDVDTIATIVAKCSQAFARLVPLERRAFGLNDQEGPSEFDALTQEELEALGNMIQKRLGTVIQAKAEPVIEPSAIE